MPMGPNLKKMINFSSLEARKTIEGTIKDLASVSGASESALIEHALCATYLPKDRNALWWVQNLYTSDAPGALADAYTGAFCYMAAGVDWAAAAPNGYPLVDAFRRVLSQQWPDLTGNEREIPHLITQLDSIANMLPDKAAPNDKDLCQTCLQQLRERPYDFLILDIPNIIVRNWDILGNHTRTYRALADIARLAGDHLINSPGTRNMFVVALKTVSDGWSTP